EGDASNLSVLLVPGASSQAVVTQEPSLSAIPGGTVTPTCSSSTAAVTSGHYPHWLEWQPRQGFRGLICRIDKLVLGIPVQFSWSLLGDKAALTFERSQPEEEAEYYSATRYSGPQLSTCTAKFGESSTSRLDISTFFCSPI
uniref:Immunoglobulin V-set domain-containing protein n=1 Tax=Vombatus ursinus TaxID=29139 RepID=A0A4X2L343_VOMUR